ncbi:MAG: sigma-70 family RNA polymerase sigma factor [Planctomycetes bacterium]|nr:sigma-70 family RNA polymerase sigma factor [Planctomycetota bacterium]
MPESLIGAWFEAARRRWPSIRWPLERYRGHVGPDEPRHPIDLFLGGAASDRYDEAWSTIHLDLREPVVRRLARLPADGMGAEDLWSETMARLMSDANDASPLPDGRRPARIRQYRGNSAMTTFIAVVAKRIAIDRFRRARMPLEGSMQIIEQSPDPRAPEPTPRDDEVRDFALRFSEAFTSLPPRQQALLSLVYGHGMPKGEAGRVLGLPAYTVSRELADSIAHLRHKLQSREGPWTGESIAVWLRGWADAGTNTKEPIHES